jgi:cytoskeleton protein RodZ
MMDNDQNNCTQGSGPGSLLCQARVAQGLSREEVAQRLHLAPRQIVALENDDYANLPGPTYVRGYLRGYANLLGLKPERVLAAYATLSGGSTKHNLSSLAPKEEITSQDHQVKLATYVVIAIVLGLAATWWQGREVEPSKPRTEQVAAVAPAPEPEAAATTGVAAPADQTAPGTAPAGTIDVPVATPTGPAIAPTHERAVTPAVQVATPVRDRMVTAKPLASPAPVALIPTPHTLPPTGGIPPTPTPAGATLTPETRASLVLYTDEESWIDVRDAAQNKLIYETVPAGRRVVLEGAVPFKVFIGNAPGVRVEFNGKPYDVGPYKRGLIARFSLGQELVPRPGAPLDR